MVLFATRVKHSGRLLFARRTSKLTESTLNTRKVFTQLSDQWASVVSKTMWTQKLSAAADFGWKLGQQRVAEQSCSDWSGDSSFNRTKFSVITMDHILAPTRATTLGSVWCTDSQNGRHPLNVATKDFIHRPQHFVIVGSAYLTILPTYAALWTSAPLTSTLQRQQHPSLGYSQLNRGRSGGAGPAVFGHGACETKRPKPSYTTALTALTRILWINLIS